jgi:hypothetical protein
LITERRALTIKTMRIVRLLVLATLLAGCAGLFLTPAEQERAKEAQAFADQIADAYKVPRVWVMVGTHVAGVGGTMREGGLLAITSMG